MSRTFTLEESTQLLCPMSMGNPALAKHCRGWHCAAFTEVVIDCRTDNDGSTVEEVALYRCGMCHEV